MWFEKLPKNSKKTTNWENGLELKNALKFETQIQKNVCELERSSEIWNYYWI